MTTVLFGSIVLSRRGGLEKKKNSPNLVYRRCLGLIMNLTSAFGVTVEYGRYRQPYQRLSTSWAPILPKLRLCRLFVVLIANLTPYDIFVTAGVFIAADSFCRKNTSASKITFLFRYSILKRFLAVPNLLLPVIDLIPP